jgi:hypothetical protein
MIRAWVRALVRVYTHLLFLEPFTLVGLVKGLRASGPRIAEIVDSLMFMGIASQIFGIYGKPQVDIRKPSISADI